MLSHSLITTTDEIAKIRVKLTSNILVVLTYELGFSVNGQQQTFTISEEKSSPRHITAKKGSSV